jgi:4'-phosphopantetheinyl transferase
MNRDLTQVEYQRLLSRVSPEKRERIARIGSFTQQQQILFGDLLVRTVISRKLAMSDDEISFHLNRFGKPLLSSNPHFHFNISHSGRYVACAIDAETVGIDVQVIRPINLEIARRFFSSEELEYILTHLGDAQKTDFFNIWTMKESYIKRSGRGLAMPLSSFNVLGMSGIYFHNVLDAPDAVCHVCSRNPVAPHVRRLNIDGFWSGFRRSR